jgi:DUF1680 family protein
LILVVLFFMPVKFASAQLVLNPMVADELQATKPLQMNGFIGDKLDASYQNRILAQDVDRLIEPFKHRTETRCWQTEFWGKWFTSAVLAYRYRPEPRLKAVLDKAVSELIATQSADGYIGNYAENSRLEQWDIWGRKYCMLGLLAYYDLTKNKQPLQAAARIADNLINEVAAKKVLIVKKGNHRGMAATSVMEPICQLYARTGDKRYLDFATEITREWESENGPQLISKSVVNVGERFPKPTSWFGWEQGQKAYEMMSCYEGLLELYRLTGNKAFKTAVEKTWENIRETEINIAGSGSSVECWFGGAKLQTMPVNHYQETCVTATWIKLSQQLLRLTGEAKYADAIEQTFYNALLGSMKPDGSDWAKYTPLAGQRLEGEEQCGMGINCCVASGPRGLFTVPITTVMTSRSGININFFIDGSYQFQTPEKQPATLKQETDYPVSGDVVFRFSIPRKEKLLVRVRIPAWSKETVLKVNGQEYANIVPGEYAEVNREWKSGDEISLQLDMRARIVTMGSNPSSMAIVRGPLVLSRDARLGGPNVEEVITPVKNKEGYLDLKPVTVDQAGIWMAFSAPFMMESHKESANKPVDLLICDYASAGNTHDDRSRFRVWLTQMIDPRGQ